MSKEVMTPEEIFTSKNDEIALKLRGLVINSIDKANEMIIKADRPEDALVAMKIAEIAGKITGIVKDKAQTNVQINQITGFTFIEASNPADAENIVQQLDGKTVSGKALLE